MKKTMAAVLALALLVSLMIIPAQAAGDQFTEGAFTYERLRNGSLKLVKYNGEDDTVYIPANVGGFAVERIAEYAFDGAKVSKVTIPESVKMISTFAFNNCKNIQRIDIPNSVYFIDGNPFTGCTSLVNIYVRTDHPTLRVIVSDGSLYSMANKMLICCPSSKAVEEYQVQENVLAIGRYAFNGCDSIKTIKLPESVVEIDEGAFWNCAKLESVNMPATMLSIGTGAFSGCASLKNVEIPDQVTRIENGTFENCAGLESVKLSDNLTDIGDRAFYGCKSLTAMNIPQHVKSIGIDAFNSCSELKDVTVPIAATAIGDGAFDNCNVSLYLHVAPYAYANIYADVYNLTVTDDNDTEFLK